MKNRWVSLAVLCSALAQGDADTVTLKDGSKVEGAVTEFKNQKFEFQSEKGTHNTYPMSDLQRIDFKLEGEDNGVAAEINHRINGNMQGRVTEFASGNFKFTQGKG